MASKNTIKEVTEKTDKEERKKALGDALKKIEKDFGKGAIMRMGDKVDTQIRTISTGSLALDTALGVGGYPRGRIVEIYGPESSGKTTVALHAVAEVQREGGTAAYIDAENALDPEYAKNLGVNIDDLLLSQPDTGEQGLEIADALVTSGAVDLVVVDSVAALVPRAEIEGEMGDAHVGLQARLMSQALRKLSGSINKTKTIALFINQIREKVGVMFGSPETTPGGRALKFYATIRLEVRRSEQIKDGTDIIGNRTKIKVVKNKVAPPFKVAEVDIMYGKGISRTGELLDMAVDKDIIDKSGSWYSYNSDRIGQGRENAKQYIGDHPDMEAEIRTKVRHAYGIDGAADSEAKPEDDKDAAGKDAKDTAAAKDSKDTKTTTSAAKPTDTKKDTPAKDDKKPAQDSKSKDAGEAIDIFDGAESKK
ncbi:recombinase RecA [Schleiferilactobacillus shenzhenensis]|uniref:Protein RecA n=1 Tax=Schleiferilactobacillus shenzhenensis LY-73 TaxID=1231336 RepID=U4TWG7_9LACO|nr:recombinase RecA [Schleiferilactobacillus shenzhenensis]ERL66183.1 RecA [Schleiferilactobacillus shenzhenensis LY-73]